MPHPDIVVTMNVTTLAFGALRRLGRPRWRRVEPPPHYDTSIAWAERLSDDLPYVRVDFLRAHGRHYFAEFTFAPFGGFLRLPYAQDAALGALFPLP